MTTLERRIRKLDGKLLCWQVHFLLDKYQRLLDIEAEKRRRAAEEARAAELEARAVREAAERLRREAEVAAERAARLQAETAAPPPAKIAPSPSAPLSPSPPPWTHDPPENMQIRPVSWGRSTVPRDYGGTYGRALTDYDPFAHDDDDDD